MANRRRHAHSAALTARELDVLARIGQGATNDAMAHRLWDGSSSAPAPTADTAPRRMSGYDMATARGGP